MGCFGFVLSVYIALFFKMCDVFSLPVQIASMDFWDENVIQLVPTIFVRLMSRYTYRQRRRAMLLYIVRRGQASFPAAFSTSQKFLSWEKLLDLSTFPGTFCALVNTRLCLVPDHSSVVPYYLYNCKHIVPTFGMSAWVHLVQIDVICYLRWNGCLCLW